SLPEQRPHSFPTRRSSDLDDAVESCLREPPDFVLMDIHMPRMDGIEATRRLRALQREGTLPRFPIVAATAGTSEAACEDVGMDRSEEHTAELQSRGHLVCR